MSLNVPEPEFLDQISGINLKSSIALKVELPLTVGNQQFTIYVDYTHIKKDAGHNEKVLEVYAPNVLKPYLGVTSRFTQNFLFKCRSKTINSVNEYEEREESESEDAEQFFMETIQPVLEVNLPRYMMQLITDNGGY